MLIHNVDILTDLDLKALVCQHESREAYATLVVQQAVADRVLKFNHGILKGWENKRTGEQKIVDEGFYGATEFNYCGIQILSSGIFKAYHSSGSILYHRRASGAGKRTSYRAFPARWPMSRLGYPEA